MKSGQKHHSCLAMYFLMLIFVNILLVLLYRKKNGQVNKLIETFPFRWVVHHYWEVCVGETIQVSKYNGDKLGVVIVEGNSYEEIINHVDEVKCYIESNIVVN